MDYRVKMAMLAFLGFICIGSLVSLDNMLVPDEPKQLEINHEVERALRQTYSQFTIEDILTHNYISDMKGVNPNYRTFDVRLLDGTLITIGYFDDDGWFHTTLKRKE